MNSSEFKKNIYPILPNQPGIYQFTENDVVLYVGKAKNIKKRVTSYFNKQTTSSRITLLISKSTHIDFTIVNSEQDALLLEDSLIKKYQPRYNIRLKDDKSYPYICIKNEPFPRVFLTRRVYDKSSEYFGPYTSAVMANALLKLIRKTFTIRTCNLSLTQANIQNKKFKPCLEYHIKNCKGPCVGYQIDSDYMKDIQQVRQILKGNLGVVKKSLKDRIKKLSTQYKYEEAKILNDKLELLEQYQNKSAIINPKLKDLDVFSYEETENTALVNYLKIIKGNVIHTKTIEISKDKHETKEEILSYVIFESREKFNSTSKEIIVPFIIPINHQYVKITIPNSGDKKRLLDLSEKNVRYFKKQHLNTSVQGDTDINLALSKMSNDLKLSELPFHIECIDNSNIQGTTPVASVVVFKNMNPSKKDYRHYNIKTVTGPDDFASMKEVVYRRYKKFIDENIKLPQLIVIDGGKGQLSAAIESLRKLNLYSKTTVIGIAKKQEAIYYPNDPHPLILDKDAESLKIIQQIRNEAHRFAITFHRKKRNSQALKSELSKIKGIGKKTAETLIKHFKSIKKLKESPNKEIEQVVGRKKAEILQKNLI